MPFSIRPIAFALAVLNCGSSSAAVCLPVPHYIYVGGGPNCDTTDIQTAIGDVVCPGTTIVVSTALGETYTGQHLALDNVSLAIAGSTAACGTPPAACDPDLGCGGGSGAPPPPAAKLSGNNAASVIYIHGDSTVTLQSLEITGGGGTDYGGGIHFSGSGALTIIDSTIDHNNASYGGGIQFQGTGGSPIDFTATLTLGAGTVIDENTAGFHGGGIEVTDSARLFALAPYTFVAFNHAPNGHGGGVHVLGPARADIASPGYNGAPVIEFNDAEYGGGIAADAPTSASSESDAIVRLFSTDPYHPVQISDNRASHTGGGVYLRPNIGTNSVGALCAFDSRIDDNIAQEGTSIYADEDSAGPPTQYLGSEVYINPDLTPRQGYVCYQPESASSLGGAGCAAGVVCNTVDDNVAEDAGSNPKPGSAILVQDSGTFDANRLTMRGNHGAHAIRVLDSVSTITNCLLADNELTAELVYVQNDGNVPGTSQYNSCTFAGNALGGSVVYAGQDVQLFNDVIDQPDNAAISAGVGATLTFDNLLVANGGGLPAQADILVARPEFVNAAAGDYHLLPTSKGVDFAAAGDSGNQDLDTDLDRRPRDVDLPDLPNVFGPRDLGAYERQSELACDDNADAVFCATFDP
jgi:hypothetical protein